MAVEPALHPDVESLAFLLGTWAECGRGVYPTIEPFDYDETVQFAHVAKPFLSYTRRSKHATEGRPLHGESGYWRHASPSAVELVLAHPTGVVEVQQGTVARTASGATIFLVSTVVAGTSTAKSITAVERDFAVERRCASVRTAHCGRRPATAAASDRSPRPSAMT